MSKVNFSELSDATLETVTGGVRIPVPLPADATRRERRAEIRRLRSINRRSREDLRAGRPTLLQAERDANRAAIADLRASLVRGTTGRPAVDLGGVINV